MPWIQPRSIPFLSSSTDTSCSFAMVQVQVPAWNDTASILYSDGTEEFWPSISLNYSFILQRQISRPGSGPSTSWNQSDWWRDHFFFSQGIRVPVTPCTPCYAALRLSERNPIRHIRPGFTICRLIFTASSSILPNLKKVTLETGHGNLLFVAGKDGFRELSCWIGWNWRLVERWGRCVWYDLIGWLGFFCIMRTSKLSWLKCIVVQLLGCVLCWWWWLVYNLVENSWGCF